MSETLCLTEFLENTGSQLRFYDMGRRISAIPRDDFLAFEQTLDTYPYPMQEEAWFALIQQRPLDMAEEPVIWFLRFKLDEQGKLIQSTRDYFIHRFMELASERPDKTDLGKALEDNPFTFKPREDKMAVFHAILSRDLGKTASSYYEHAADYFSGKLGWDQWSFVGYQGIADVAARHQQDSLSDILIQAVPQLPHEPLIALCHCLENQTLNNKLAQALLSQLQTSCKNEQAPAALLAALLRSVSCAENRIRDAAVQTLLSHPMASDIEVLAAIGGRTWESLLNAGLANAYLEVLSDPEVGQAVFNHCLADLLHMPDMQQAMLDVLRSPDRSEQLALAFQTMTNPLAD